MQRKELEGDKAKPDSVENHIFENAIGIPIELSGTPTTSKAQLKENEVGYDSSLATPDFLYITLKGKIFKITLTEST